MDPAEFASPENFPCLLWIVAVDEGATRTLVFGGEWDISNCDDAWHAIALALGRGPERLVLDLSGVSFIDATAVHQVLDAHKRAVAQGTRLQIAPGPRSVQRVFDLSGLSDELPFTGEDGNL